MAVEAGHAQTGSLSRRKLLGRAGKVGVAAAVVGGTTAALAGPAGATLSHDDDGRQTTITLDVDTEGFADYQAPAATDEELAGGPFYVSGKILDPHSKSGKQIGTFHCWGFISESGPNKGTGVVTQEFDLGDKGKILIAGVESDAPRGVTGGTGYFKHASGEGSPDLEIFDFMNTGKFRITFHVVGLT